VAGKAEPRGPKAGEAGAAAGGSGVDDPVARLVAQWEPERPDLDLRAMATVARLHVLGRLVDAEFARTAARYGVDTAEADILFTLRRAGEPYRLTPSRLAESLLVSSGTLTSRLDRLERKELVARVPHPRDRRSVEVELTPRGRDVVDEAVTVHVENERRMLEPLGERDLDALDRLTSRLLKHLAERPPEG
jgi:DNA-binding MarR family transcriptional regulator